MSCQSHLWCVLGDPKTLKTILFGLDYISLRLQLEGWLNVGGGGGECKVCDSIVVADTFQSTVQRCTFHINHHFDYNSQGVVYLITCGKCSKQYVGNTVTSFRLRFNNHKSSLNRFSKGQRGLCGYISLKRAIRVLMILKHRLSISRMLINLQRGKVFGLKN